VFSPDGRATLARLRRSEETTWVTAEAFDTAERALRASFKARRRDLTLRPGETVGSASQRIAGLVREAMEENASHLWWTARRSEKSERVGIDRQYRLAREPDGSWTRRYVGPPPARGPWRYRITSRPQERHDEASRSWKPIEVPVHIVEEYDADSQAWRPWPMKVPEGVNPADFLARMVRQTPWTLKVAWREFVADLRDPISRMLCGELGRLGKSGRPAYLACATLGALLNVPPEHIHDVLNNYRHPRRR
jgi:hypothetical protein